MELTQAGKVAIHHAALCGRCRSMFKSEDKNGLHHATLEEFREAIASRCRVCMASTSLLNGLSDEGTVNTAADEHFITWKIYDGNNFKFALRANSAKLEHYKYIMWNLQSLKEASLAITDCLEDVEISSRNGMVSQLSNPSANYTGHPSVLAQARSWLSECLSNHRGQHSSPSVTTWYPKRLLDVSKGKITLIETKDVPATGPYATLSYCRGPSFQGAGLTYEKYETFKEFINPVDLPQTFVDAIDVVRQLEFNYLWIEALCVLQSGSDSVKDQSQNDDDLADIYANCTICISADWGADPNSGLYRTRDLDLIQPILVWANGRNSRDDGVYVPILPDVHGRAAVENEKIHRKAWFMQERALAPRILHFGTRQVFWECNAQRLACEAFPHSPPPRAGEVRRDYTFNIPTWSKEEWHVYEFWTGFCRDYNRRKFDNPHKEKLNGLAGIAKRIARHVGDTYHAGIFRKQMPNQLLWYVEEPKHVELKYTAGAPSWSWLCVDSPVNISPSRLADKFDKGSSKDIEAEVVDVKTWPRSKMGSHWGGDQRGFITLESTVLRAAKAPNGKIAIDDIDEAIISAVDVRWDSEQNHCDREIRPEDFIEDMRLVVILGTYDPDYQLHGLTLSWDDEEEAYVRTGYFKISLIWKSKELEKNGKYWEMVRIA